MLCVAGGIAPPVDEWKKIIDEMNARARKLEEDYEGTCTIKKVSFERLNHIYVDWRAWTVRRIGWMEGRSGQDGAWNQTGNLRADGGTCGRRN